VVNKQNASEPGNYGRVWLGITGKSTEDPAKRTRALNSELVNGRLALGAIMGIMFLSGTFGTTGSELAVEGNQLSGAMLPGIGSLASLTWPALVGNQISGAIPSEISNLGAGLGRLPVQRGHAAGDRQPREPDVASLGWQPAQRRHPAGDRQPQSWLW
jgi:hypothetical protein